MEATERDKVYAPLIKMARNMHLNKVDEATADLNKFYRFARLDNQPAELLSFIMSMINADASQRWSFEKLLLHPWIVAWTQFVRFFLAMAQMAKTTKTRQQRPRVNKTIQKVPKQKKETLVKPKRT